LTISKPVPEKLRSQLANITRDFANNPPKLLTRRSTLIAELNEISKTDADQPDTQNLHYQIWWQKWHDLMALEQMMQTETLREFLTATKLGEKLQNQIDNYAKLDIAALLAAVEQGINLAGHIHQLSPQELVNEGTNLLETATN
jgi:stage III sporulation protein SpoIIIAA